MSVEVVVVVNDNERGMCRTTPTTSTRLGGGVMPGNNIAGVRDGDAAKQ